MLANSLAVALVGIFLTGSLVMVQPLEKKPVPSVTPSSTHSELTGSLIIKV